MLAGDPEDGARSALLSSLGWDDAVDADEPLFSQGLLPEQAGALESCVEQLVGKRAPPGLLLSCPTINALASYVAHQQANNAADGGLPLSPSLAAEPPRSAFKIRRAELRDVPQLVELEKTMWPWPLQGMRAEDIERRIQRFGAGQLVVVDAVFDGTVVGSLYTQRISSLDVLHGGSFRDAIALHVDDGPIWQLITIQVEPSHATQGLGDTLILQALTVAKAEGVRDAVAVTRCRSWAAARQSDPTLSMLEHARQGVDPGISFHTGRGAQVVDLVPGWRSEDDDNCGIGVLIRYEVDQFRLLRSADDQASPARSRNELLRRLSQAGEPGSPAMSRSGSFRRLASMSMDDPGSPALSRSGSFRSRSLEDSRSPAASRSGSFRNRSSDDETKSLDQMLAEQTDLALASGEAAEVSPDESSSFEEVQPGQATPQEAAVVDLSQMATHELLSEMEPIARRIIEAEDPIGFDAPLMEAGLDSFLVPTLAEVRSSSHRPSIHSIPLDVRACVHLTGTRSAHGRATPPDGRLGVRHAACHRRSRAQRVHRHRAAVSG